MSPQDLRNAFCSFFKKKGHKELPSSPLILQDDPTLLFANAGMNQFKDYFTGKSTPPHQCAVTIQKCVRAGGKHNDLENVGPSARHHTYFEMLGNFSFGDYFKKEAIEYAWEFLTSELKLPADKMLITVHKDDQESYRLWQEHIGIASDKIFYKGDKDNFWEMGETGPCGPCSEIFYDYGEAHTTKGFASTPDNPFDDGGRFVEIWNLVFMQYEKVANGKRTLLPNPSIDTGMGLERLLAAMNNRYVNYETDLFVPLIAHIEKILPQSPSPSPQNLHRLRAIADHARSCTMLITDGVIPSNEGCGYVLRRIIRRAVRHLRELGASANSMSQLVDPVFELLGEAWPENARHASLAKNFLKAEEEKFLETLDQGLKFLNNALKTDLQNKTLKGQTAFKLYDTYGFPLDLTEAILRDQGLILDTLGFEAAMEERRKDSRKSWKGGRGNDQKIFHDVKKEWGETHFTGYEKHSDTAKLLKILPTTPSTVLIFDQSPFYAEGGGQVGDTGAILDDHGHVLARIEDTQKPIEGLHAHHTSNPGTLTEGKQYKLVIDRERRAAIAKNHSATHLLQSALIATLGDHVKQSGSLVTDQKLRFDFAHTSALKTKEIQSVEKAVNDHIAAALNVTPEVTSMEKARKKGALALFGEKYGDQVRTLQMGGVSLELCGGTHVSNTSEIGMFSIVEESSPGSGIRRIEAVTSTIALKRLQERSETLKNIERLTGIKGDQNVQKIESLLEEVKGQQKKLAQLSEEIGLAKLSNFFEEVENLGKDLVFKCARAPDGVDLKQLSDRFINKHQKGILALYSIKGKKATVLLRCGKGLIDCPAVLNESLRPLGGRGGGRKDMAQGSIDAKQAPLLEEHVKKAVTNTFQNSLQI